MASQWLASPLRLLVIPTPFLGLFCFPPARMTLSEGDLDAKPRKSSVGKAGSQQSHEEVTPNPRTCQAVLCLELSLSREAKPGAWVPSQWSVLQLFLRSLTRYKATGHTAAQSWTGKHVLPGKTSLEEYLRRAARHGRKTPCGWSRSDGGPTHRPAPVWAVWPRVVGASPDDRAGPSWLTLREPQQCLAEGDHRGPGFRDVN